MKHYLNTKTGEVWEIDPATKGDLSDHADFTEMNEQQTKFWIKCKEILITPTLEEMQTLRMRSFLPEAPPPSSPLDEYKRDKLGELSRLSQSTANALREKSRKKPKVKAGDLAKEIRRVSVMCGEEFRRVAELINLATDTEGVDGAFGANQYSTFK